MFLFKITFLWFFSLSSLLLFSSCDSEVSVSLSTPSVVKIRNFTISSDNQYLTVELNNASFGNSTSSQPVSSSCFALSSQKKSGNVSTILLESITQMNGLALVGGELNYKLNINLINTPTGDEVISLSIIKDCIFSKDGIAIDEINSGLSVSPNDQSYSTINYNWVAFNDASELSTGNVTSLGLINSSSNSGMLVKNIDNSATGVTATFTTNTIGGWNIDTSPNSGTDAFDLFNGKINLSGISSYTVSSDWFYQVELNGLSTNKSYAIFLYANRDNVSYAGSDSSSRWSLFSLSGSTSAINTSGIGVEEENENQVKLNGGYNTVNGALVGWSKIKTSTGSIVIKSENVGSIGPGETYKSYGFQAFALMELSE